MSRYLTPSKIGLLALAAVYVDGVVSTAEITSVLSFLLSHILPDNSQLSSVIGKDKQHAVPISSFESALSTRSSAIPGRTVWDLLLKKLWSLDCSDAFDSFVTNLPILLTKSREQLAKEREVGAETENSGRIVSTSPLGAFIRRCYLEYTRLQFQDGIRLWQDFISFRSPTRHAWERKNPSDSRSALDVNLSDLHIDASHPLAQLMYLRLVTEDEPSSGYSTFDVERLMEFQVSELQRLGGRLPDDMRSKLEYIGKSGASLPKLAHYLKFLDSWRAGDYSSAFDNLHRYFDYTMQTRDRTFYQYALLNLAILQADFGCYNEAIPAMQEAIATARESKDTTCLNFCISWLYHFRKTFPSEMKELRESGILGSETEGLAFLKSRAKDSEMWSLLSTSLLSEAKLGLQHGDGLSAVFENIAKATHINIIKSVSNVVGPTLLMKGSVYARAGLAHLAWSCGESFLECYAKEAPAEDVLKCTCRMSSLLVQRGRYNEATEKMENISKEILRVLKHHQYWTFYLTMLKLRRYLHRHDLDAATHTLQRLKGQGTPDIELSFSLSLLETNLLIRRNSMNDALQLIEALAHKVQSENPDVMAQVKLLNLKATILAKCGHPLKAFTIVLRAANMAHRARILSVLWEAAGLLAHILSELKEFAASITLLEAVVPQVLECQDCHLAARIYSFLADAYVGLAGEKESSSLRNKDHISKTMDYVDAALEQFRRIEDLKGQMEMLAKKATIMRWRGDLALANDTAAKYLELKKEYEAARV